MSYSWFFQGYQFWTRADNHGNFLIKNIRAGDYNLYAFVPGFIGDYKYEANITVEPGNKQLSFNHVSEKINQIKPNQIKLLIL